MTEFYGSQDKGDTFVKTHIFKIDDSFNLSLLSDNNDEYNRQLLSVYLTPCIGDVTSFDDILTTIKPMIDERDRVLYVVETIVNKYSQKCIYTIAFRKLIINENKQCWKAIKHDYVIFNGYNAYISDKFQRKNITDNTDYKLFLAI